MGFWSRAATLLPTLGDEGRQKLFQLLWEDLPSFSKLFSILQQTFMDDKQNHRITIIA
jgi:hypothetical protein